MIFITISVIDFIDLYTSADGCDALYETCIFEASVVASSASVAFEACYVSAEW